MYNFNEIEKKWQKYWDENDTFKAYNDSDKPKYYVLVEFPYPSGIGLHIGHPRSYTALDSIAHKRRLEGYNVLFPMGWDAFGLPAENYAIKNKIHPKEAVKENIKVFKNQCQSLGISFDWEREFSTTDPEYYKWTQWQFLKFYEHGLAYKAKKPINWCTSCKVGLSNEDVEHGRCERCGGEVVQREKDQWMLKMSTYADELLKGLDQTEFIDRVKTAQINWIGKSEGAEIDFKITTGGTDLGGPIFNDKIQKMLGIIDIIYKKFNNNNIKIWFNGTFGVSGYYGSFFADPEDIDCGVLMEDFQKALPIIKQVGFNLFEEKHYEKFKVARFSKDDIILELGTFDHDLGEHKVKLSDVIFPVPNAKWLAEWYRIISKKERRRGKNDDLRAKYLESISFDNKIKVYTTRLDTIYGATFMVVAPEHPIIDKVSNQINNLDEIKAYQQEAKKKSEFERTELVKDKTGVKIDGIKAINPVTGEEVDIFIADYVMMGYGTGAIMAVPAHDQRDYEFAVKYNIPIKQVIAPYFPPDDDNKLNPDAKTVTRKAVIVALRHPKEDKYLCLDWSMKNWHSFICGGIEENETIEEAVIREVKEETGYQNLKVEKILFEYHNEFYAAHKGVNRYAIATPVIATLEDETKVEVDSKEQSLHTPVWIEKDKLIEYQNISNYRYVAGLVVNKDQAYTGEGVMINSGILNGIDNKKDSIEKIIAYLEEKGLGKKTTNYRLQDWVFSRQRFWGEPIPMIYCDECGWVPVPEEDLPVLLPDIAEYEPTDNGESPLANMPEWYKVSCPKCGKEARRETDTMPNWAGSSWYWLRYMDPHNDKEFVSEEALKYWGKVDWYNGGMEHATRHLLYARFWHRFLHDIGLVPTPEPFIKRTAHGMILGEDGSKISKSKGNGIDPIDIIIKYGADALRTYEMFIGDYEMDTAWSMNGLKGCKRFLDRLWKIQDKVVEGKDYSKELETSIHKAIKKVSNDLEILKFNTAISTLMTLLNEYEACPHITKADLRIFLILLNPIAPHITEEINERKQLGKPLCRSNWPEYDEAKTIDDKYELVIQINGKVRGKIEVENNISKEEMEKIAFELDNVKKYVEGLEIIKVIVIPNKLVNIVVK